MFADTEDEDNRRDAEDRAHRNFAQTWLRLHYNKRWRGFRHAKRKLSCMTHLMARRLAEWREEDWNRYYAVSFKEWQQAGGQIFRTPTFDLESVACGLLRRCAPGLHVTNKEKPSESSMIFSATLPEKSQRFEEGLTETWHGTSLPWFFRIYHDPYRQLHPGSAVPVGVYLFDNAHKEKAYGYASWFPLLRTIWCRIVVHCAAHEPKRIKNDQGKRIRHDQLYSQLVYMVGAELMIKRSEALDNSEFVIGVDKNKQILDVGEMSDDD